jgi:hypothetical protein
VIWSILSLGIWLGIWGILWSMWDRRAFAPAVLMAIGIVSAVAVEVMS